MNNSKAYFVIDDRAYSILIIAHWLIIQTTEVENISTIPGSDFPLPLQQVKSKDW